MAQDQDGPPATFESECPFCERVVLVYEDPPHCPLCGCPLDEERMHRFVWPNDIAPDEEPTPPLDGAAS